LVSSGITAYDLNKIKNYINDLDEFISETISLIQEGYNPIEVIKQYDQFVNAGMSYREANDWVARGFSFNEAIAWKNAGFSLKEALEWRQAGFFAKEAIEWKNANISANEAKDWKNAGFSPNEAIEWKNAGFSIIYAEDWSKFSTIYIYAKDWKNAGFSPNDAKKFVESNVPLEDIKFFKKLRKIIFRFLFVIGITFIPLVNPYLRKNFFLSFIFSVSLFITTFLIFISLISLISLIILLISFIFQIFFTRKISSNKNKFQKLLILFLFPIPYFFFFPPFTTIIIKRLIPIFYRNLSPESAKLFSIISIVLLYFIFFLPWYLMIVFSDVDISTLMR
jgi:hypothetical protein